tara:strand:+ start:244 stop:438 length:195 start_codon:yes stop_codon:yes gene_type:complete
MAVPNARVETLSTSKTSSVYLNRLMVISALLVAVVTIYVVGLEPMGIVHDSFHDVRHAFGFPCH